MRFVLTLLLLIPGFAFAAGGGGGGAAAPAPPKQTQTTKDCFSERQWDPEIKKYVRFSKKVNGVWDAKSGKCIRPDKTSSLDPDTQYGAVRELAYGGRYDEAQQVLAAMPDQADDWVLTYWGFTHRKLGNVDLAQAFYEDAIRRNPDNILARSYMGQGLVERGLIDEAIVEWREIKARGGEGSWAEVSLRSALRSGITYDY